MSFALPELHNGHESVRAVRPDIVAEQAEPADDGPEGPRDLAAEGGGERPAEPAGRVRRGAEPREGGLRGVCALISTFKLQLISQLRLLNRRLC